MPGPVDDLLGPLADRPELVAAADRARAAVDEVRTQRVLRRYAHRVAAESALRGARASAALDGVDVGLEVLRGSATDDPVLQGALRVAAELGPLTPTWTRAPLQALARLHALAAAGLTGPDALGRPRPSAAGRLTGLAELLSRPTAAPALVVAAVVHAEIAALDVFPSGSGMVARAAERLTLGSRGLDPGGLVAPEVGHLELGRAAYADALRGYLAGGQDGVAGWVAHCADAVVLGARDALAVCEAIRRGG